MRFKIHDGSPHEPDTIYLGLIEADPGNVMLAVVDQDGRCLTDPDNEVHGGALLIVTNEGRIALSPAVMPSLGIDLDVDGRIKLDPYTERITAQRAQRYGGKRAAVKVVK